MKKIFKKLRHYWHNWKVYKFLIFGNYEWDWAYLTNMIGHKLEQMYLYHKDADMVEGQEEMAQEIYHAYILWSQFEDEPWFYEEGLKNREEMADEYVNDALESLKNLRTWWD